MTCGKNQSPNLIIIELSIAEGSIVRESRKSRQVKVAVIIAWIEGFH